MTNHDEKQIHRHRSGGLCRRRPAISNRNRAEPKMDYRRTEARPDMRGLLHTAPSGAMHSQIAAAVGVDGDVDPYGVVREYVGHALGPLDQAHGA